MPLKVNETDNVSEVEPVTATPPANEPSIMRMAHLFLVGKLKALEGKVEHETAIIAERSKLIDFLSRYHQILNGQSTVDPKTGKLDLSKHDKIDDFFKEAEELKALAEEKRRQAAELPESESKQRDLLIQQANEIDDTVNATSLLLGKREFSKEERAQLLDNVRLQQDLLKTQQSYNAHEVQRHTGERNEMIPLVREIMNKLYETIRKTFSGASAR